MDGNIRLFHFPDRRARWSRFWLDARRVPGHALPHYQHGNDSGWDNATTFDPGHVIQTSDLAAFLVLQMRELAGLAGELGRHRVRRVVRVGRHLDRHLPAVGERVTKIVTEVTDRDVAETWRGRYLLADTADMPEPDDDEMYIFALIGNFEYFEIFDRTGITSLVDPYSESATHQVNLIVYTRTDSRIMLANAFAAITC